MPPSILDVHTPTSSFSIPHSCRTQSVFVDKRAEEDPVHQETLETLYSTLSRKVPTPSARVGPGWLKYQYNGSIWNLDDEADYSIFSWRCAPTSTTTLSTPTIYMANPDVPLPIPPAYHNLSYYVFQPTAPVQPSPKTGPKSLKAKSVKSSKSRKSRLTDYEEHDDGSGVPRYKREFDRFHSENGVRTVMGKIGPISNVRMLLKSGYRHVYISRAFAKRHGFIPADATPGFYGYSGLINIGQWPITVGTKTTTHAVYLSEETHFDVVLGRSFQETRGIKTDAADLTYVVCLDTGEKLDCELVVIRDGRGQVVTVT